jgi:hypothetical protein
MAFFLVLVIFGTVVEPRSAEAIAPLAIGLTATMPSDRPSCSRTSPSGIRSLSLGAEKVMLRFAGLADTITTPQWRGADQ